MPLTPSDSPANRCGGVREQSFLTRSSPPGLPNLVLAFRQVARTNASNPAVQVNVSVGFLGECFKSAHPLFCPPSAGKPGWYDGRGKVLLFISNQPGPAPPGR